MRYSELNTCRFATLEESALNIKNMIHTLCYKLICKLRATRLKTPRNKLLGAKYVFKYFKVIYSQFDDVLKTIVYRIYHCIYVILSFKECKVAWENVSRATLHMDNGTSLVDALMTIFLLYFQALVEFQYFLCE